MKIYSRPSLEDGDMVIGGGSNLLKLTDEQLELIAALVCSCRLGQHTYANAAYEIVDMIETVYGSDWMHDASDNVDLQVTIEDNNGDVVFATAPGQHLITLEV